MKNKSLATLFSEKIRLSLALKLKFKAFLTILCKYISLDIFLIILTALSIAIKTEYQANEIIGQVQDLTTIMIDHDNFQEDKAIFPMNLTIFEYKEIHYDSINFQVPFIYKITSSNQGAYRYFYSSNSHRENLQDLLTHSGYILAIPEVATFDYKLTTDAKIYFNIFKIIFIYQGFQLLSVFHKYGKHAKKTLKPISELADNARKISGENINLKLEMGGTQNELVDLAKVINEMLDRIKESYSSQIRFVSDASHELRTPIAVVQGYANLLDRWGKEDPKMLQEAIDAIKDETASMKDLVEQLLFLARGDNNSMKVNMQIFNMSDLVEETISQTRLIDKSHKFKIKTIQPAYIYGDIQLIKQAMRILIDNAIKYTPTNGSILLSSYVEQNRSILVVQDEGIGISSQDLPHIFERFYRADEARTRKEGGSGLGLSIADWIIRRHKGVFDVVSREGVGTRIMIQFPYAENVLDTADLNNKSDNTENAELKSKSKKPKQKKK